MSELEFFSNDVCPFAYRVRIWIDYCNTAFQPNYCGLVFELVENKHDAIRNTLYKSLKTIDEALKKTAPGPFWLGKQLSLVDLSYYPFFEHAPVLSYYRNFDIPAEHKHIRRWLSAMRDRPSVKANQCDDAFYIKAYKPFVEGKVEHDKKYLPH